MAEDVNLPIETIDDLLEIPRGNSWQEERNFAPLQKGNPHPGEWHYKYDCQHCKKGKA